MYDVKPAMPCCGDEKEVRSDTVKQVDYLADVNRHILHMSK